MTMRQLSLEESNAVGGAACDSLTLTFGLTGPSVSGSLGDWWGCASAASNYVSDLFGAFDAYMKTGIPYGEPHVG
jgi:hypothetical protein